MSIIFCRQNRYYLFEWQALDVLIGGVLEDSTYVNNQANIKFTVPAGWEAKVGKDVQDFIKDYAANTNNTEKEESFSAIDLTCYNANTGSNVAVSYLLNQKNEKFDQYVDSTIAAILKQSTGITKRIHKQICSRKPLLGIHALFM